jgi:hypothetical protein
MTAAVLEDRELDQPRQLARVAGGAWDQFDVRQVDVLRSRVGRSREKPERSQLVVAQSLRQQFVLGDHARLERFMQARDRPRLGGRGTSDPADVP